MNSAEKACDTTLDDETNGNIIECCNNTHKGALYSVKQTCTLDVGDSSHVSCLLIVGNFLVIVIVAVSVMIVLLVWMACHSSTLELGKLLCSFLPSLSPLYRLILTRTCVWSVLSTRSSCCELDAYIKYVQSVKTRPCHVCQGAVWLSALWHFAVQATFDGWVLHTLIVTSIRQHLSYDDCLEDKREDYQNCSVL